jgi:ribose-phosphate pyrophosphokinase
MEAHKLKIFTGNSNLPLAKEICDYLNTELASAEVTRFSDGEIMVRINENIRGRDIFIIQSTCPPINENLVELLIIIDALKRSSAKRITAVLPYYGYARQDRKVEPRVPITAKLVANIITAAGVDRVLTMDLHAGQIQGFFDIPVDNLFATPVLLDYFFKKDFKDLVVVSPDAGGVERARAFAKRLKASLAIIDKRRVGVNDTQVMHIIGEVDDRDAIILDDMIDTGGTLAKAARALRDQGARRIIAACTHPVFSGPIAERLSDPVLSEVVVTNTIPLNEEAGRMDKIVTLSVAPLLGEAIKRIHEETSVSSLFV